jgi:hypothetical protein
MLVLWLGELWLLQVVGRASVEGMRGLLKVLQSEYQSNRREGEWPPHISPVSKAALAHVVCFTPTPTGGIHCSPRATPSSNYRVFEESMQGWSQ